MNEMGLLRPSFINFYLTQGFVLKYAIQCAKQHRPFFAGDKNDTFNKFSSCESVPLEIMLLALLYTKN
jgi:hypothetical protein